MTEDKNVQDQIARLAAIVSSSEEAIIGLTLDGIITDWSPGAERLYGYSASEILGKPVSILISPGSTELDNILPKVRNGESIERYETVRVRKDGQLVDISLSASPIKDGHGRIIGVSWIGHDITQSKQLEREREQLLKDVRARAEECDRLNSLMQEINGRLTVTSIQLQEKTEEAVNLVSELDATISSIGHAVLIYNKEGEVIRANPAAANLFGYTPAGFHRPFIEEARMLGVETAEGKPFPPEEEPAVKAISGESIQGVIAVLHPPHRPVTRVSINASPVRKPDGEIIGAVAVLTDITGTEQSRL